ncbi:MAG: hypothetical protein IJ660_04405 [Alphaproteobacteria bacterium]|nr:hypothetical protein [Alphaproteobacteria bacterium]
MRKLLYLCSTILLTTYSIAQARVEFIAKDDGVSFNGGRNILFCPAGQKRSGDKCIPDCKKSEYPFTAKPDETKGKVETCDNRYKYAYCYKGYTGNAKGECVLTDCSGFPLKADEIDETIGLTESCQSGSDTFYKYTKCYNKEAWNLENGRCIPHKCSGGTYPYDYSVSAPNDKVGHHKTCQSGEKTYWGYIDCIQPDWKSENGFCYNQCTGFNSSVDEIEGCAQTSYCVAKEGTKYACTQCDENQGYQKNPVNGQCVLLNPADDDANKDPDKNKDENKPDEWKDHKVGDIYYHKDKPIGVVYYVGDDGYDVRIISLYDIDIDNSGNVIELPPHSLDKITCGYTNSSYSEFCRGKLNYDVYLNNGMPCYLKNKNCSYISSEHSYDNHKAQYELSQQEAIRDLVPLGEEMSGKELTQVALRLARCSYSDDNANEYLEDGMHFEKYLLRDQGEDSVTKEMHERCTALLDVDSLNKLKQREFTETTISRNKEKGRKYMVTYFEPVFHYAPAVCEEDSICGKGNWYLPAPKEWETIRAKWENNGSIYQALEKAKGEQFASENKFYYQESYDWVGGKVIATVDDKPSPFVYASSLLNSRWSRGGGIVTNSYATHSGRDGKYKLLQDVTEYMWNHSFATDVPPLFRPALKIDRCAVEGHPYGYDPKTKSCRTFPADYTLEKCPEGAICSVMTSDGKTMYKLVDCDNDYQLQNGVCRCLKPVKVSGTLDGTYDCSMCHPEWGGNMCSLQVYLDGDTPAYAYGYVSFGLGWEGARELGISTAESNQKISITHENQCGTVRLRYGYPPEDDQDDAKGCTRTNHGLYFTEKGCKEVGEKYFGSSQKGKEIDIINEYDYDPVWSIGGFKYCTPTCTGFDLESCPDGKKCLVCQKCVDKMYLANLWNQIKNLAKELGVTPTIMPNNSKSEDTFVSHYDNPREQAAKIEKFRQQRNLNGLQTQLWNELNTLGLDPEKVDLEDGALSLCFDKYKAE